MKPLELQPDWADSWKLSHHYDLMELWGDTRHRGYAYAYANRRRATLDLLVDVLVPGARVLDMAAAQGNFSIALAEQGYRVTWNDLRGELEPYVRMKHRKGEIHYAPGNAFELKLGEPFDAVLMTEVIEHVAHPDEFLRNAAQLVRPGGYLIMTTPNGAYFRNRLPRFSECADPAQFEAVQFQPDGDGHIFLLHPDEVPPLAANAGLSIDRFDLFTNPLTNGHVKTERLLHVLPRGLVEAAERLSQRLPSFVGRRLLVQMGVRFRRGIAPASG
jgi:2-polyprenyl-6-hydroxyphenyl methylase/3-demethylubiquinone-9 3-methyltransferase